MILKAAIKTKDGKIYSLDVPARHHNIFRECNIESSLIDHVQGFIDNNIGFVDREKAMEIVNKQNQKLIRKKTYPENQLFSEDLW